MHVIDHFSADQPNLLLLGDFNVHVDDTDCCEAILFLDATSVSMSPWAHTALVICWTSSSPSGEAAVGDVWTYDLSISDHLLPVPEASCSLKAHPLAAFQTDGYWPGC